MSLSVRRRRLLNTTNLGPRVLLAVWLAVWLAVFAAMSPAWAMRPLEPEPTPTFVLHAPPEVPVHPWRSTADMREWLQREVSRAGSQDDRMLRLLGALQRLDLSYDDTVTLTAPEVFASRVFNCLSAAHLVVGLARELGVDAYYVRVQIPDAYHQRGDLMLAAAHIAAGWGPPGKIRIVEIGANTTDASRPRQRVGDRVAHAMHYANRSAETLAQGDPEVALEWIFQALQMDPTSADAWVNRGVAERRLGRLRAAESSYLTALDHDPEHRAALHNLAVLEELSGNRHLARAILDGLVRSGHRNPQTLVALGDLYLRSGRVDAARPFFRRAVRLGRGLPAVLAARGRWHVAAGSHAAAHRWLERAAAVDPADVEVIRLRELLAGLPAL